MPIDRVNKGQDDRYTQATSKKPETNPLINLTREVALEKLRRGIYVPENVLKKLGLEKEFKSIKAATGHSLVQEKGPFAKAKIATKENLQAPASEKDPKPFPKSSLTRLLTGDVKAEWLVGLGKMKADKVTPAEGYKDVFASSMEAYQKKGIQFDPKKSNDPVEMAKKLDLKGDDLKKIEQNGAWLVEIHPGSKLAIPTERKSAWNPEYIEGGYTKSEQQEWVTPNVGLEKEMLAGNVRIYKMDTAGNTVEWKFFKGKLMPHEEWRKAIQTHASEVSKKNQGKS